MRTPARRSPLPASFALMRTQFIIARRQRRDDLVATVTRYLNKIATLRSQ